MIQNPVLFIGEIVLGGTSGSIPYVSSTNLLAQNNANLFWDAVNLRLGVGTASPTAVLHVSGNTVNAQATSLQMSQSSTGANAVSTFAANAVNTSSFGTITSSGNAWGLLFTVLPTVTLNGTSAIFQALGNTGAVNTSAVTIGGSATGNRLIAYGNYGTITALPIFNSTGPSGRAEVAAVAGSITGSPTLTAVGTGSVLNLYGVIVSNAGASGGTANLTVNSYGIYSEATGDLTTTGTTTHYGGRFIASGTADINYGIYVDTPSGATTNYGAVFAGGNVGIGITAPTAQLHVSSTILITAAIQQTSLQIQGSNSDIGISIENSGTGGVNWQFLSSSGATGLAQGQFTLWNASSGAARLTVTSAGATSIKNLSTGIVHASSVGLLTSSAVDLASSEITGTLGVTHGGTGTATQFTAGSVVFAGASGVYTQDNATFFWDNSNKRLGINNAAPKAQVHIGAGADTPFIDGAILYLSNAGTSHMVVRDSTNDVEQIVYTYSGGCIIGVTTNHPFSIRTNNADRVYITNGGNVGIGGGSPTHVFQLTGSDDAAKTTTTTWATTSDKRTKDKIQPFTDGLSVVKELNPITFEYNGVFQTPKGESSVSLVAQDTVQNAPYLFKTHVSPVDEKGNDGETEYYTFNPHAIFFLLINAVKELSDRLDILERR